MSNFGKIAHLNSPTKWCALRCVTHQKHIDEIAFVMPCRGERRVNDKTATPSKTTQDDWGERSYDAPDNSWDQEWGMAEASTGDSTNLVNQEPSIRQGQDDVVDDSMSEWGDFSQVDVSAFWPEQGSEGSDAPVGSAGNADHIEGLRARLAANEL